MSIPWFNYAGAVVGVLILAQGAYAQLRPAQAGTAFGIETSSTNPEAVAFVKVFGSRNMSLGTAILVLFFMDRYFEMGIVILCLNISSTFDGAVVATDVGGRRGNVLPHMGSGFVFSLIGGGIVGWYT